MNETSSDNGFINGVGSASTQFHPYLVHNSENYVLGNIFCTNNISTAFFLSPQCLFFYLLVDAFT